MATEAQQLPPNERPLNRDAGWKTRFDHDAMRKFENKHFTAYYQAQRLVPPEEWDSLQADLRSQLPQTLWINDTDPLAADVAAYFESLGPATMSKIDWYPIPNMAWRINVDKHDFRKSPELAPLRQYLIRQTAMGTTSRQEAVSMIPPFLLDIQANDKCLDMCASPGSKTAQMLAILGRAKRRTQGVDSPFPFDYLTGGCVVANEKDEKRANMLVHQCKRLRLLFPFAAFVNHDARYLPDLLDASGTKPKYDKVLCDVVCTGDGTLRKAPGLIKKWRSFEATNLQRLQIQIALRGCHLLRVGGRMVYSTCSLNPIENEAVVTQIIQRTNGAMRLVDPTGMIPGLQYDPGMTSWTVISAKGEVAAAPGDHQMHPNCFPPTEDLQLQRCMRLLPKHCNGGGFFVAVLEKVGEYEQPELDPAEQGKRRPIKLPRPERQKAAAAAATEKDDEDKEDDAVGSKTPEPDSEKKDRLAPTFVDAPADAVDYLHNFYRVSGFPTSHLVCRTQTGEADLRVSQGTTCCLVADDVRTLLANRGRLIVVAAGLRVLAIESLTKGWRIAHEATRLFTVLMAQSPRVVHGGVTSIAEMCGEASTANGLPIEKLSDEKLRAQLEPLAQGCCILVVPSRCGPVPVAVLRARSRVQLLVDKDELAELKCRLDIAVAEGEIADE